MPVYEYECLKCGEKFEQQRSVSEIDNEVRCPKCGGKSRRRVSLFGFGKGSGSPGGSSHSCGPSSHT